MNVVLKLSKLCNLRCTYCYEYEQLGERARMPLEGLAFFFETLATELARRQVRQVRFALHGGEPLLLPEVYLRRLVALQRTILARHGIAFANSMQTNLYKVRPGTLELLADLDIALGVSIDVHGGERKSAAGNDAERRVRDNLDALIASGAQRRIRLGGISVLHAGNVHQAAGTFRFFAERGLGYRILPIFAMTDAPPRLRHLLLDPAAVVAALQDVFRARLSWQGPRIDVQPLEDYLKAAVLQQRGLRGHVYDPHEGEWALIVDTNGDTYTHGEAYEPHACLGNVFRNPFADLLNSATRRRLLAIRAERAKTCEACRFGSACSRIPMIEALPSERIRDGTSALRCAVAQPVIAYIAALLTASPATATRVRDARPPPPGRTATA